MGIFCFKKSPGGWCRTMKRLAVFAAAALLGCSEPAPTAPSAIGLTADEIQQRIDELNETYPGPSHWKDEMLDGLERERDRLRHQK